MSRKSLEKQPGSRLILVDLPSRYCSGLKWHERSNKLLFLIPPPPLCWLWWRLRWCSFTIAIKTFSSTMPDCVKWLNCIIWTCRSYYTLKNFTILQCIALFEIFSLLSLTESSYKNFFANNFIFWVKFTSVLNLSKKNARKMHQTACATHASIE